MASKHPDGWHEPIREALWKADTLLGCPPKSQLHWFIWLALMLFSRKYGFAIAGASLQAVLVVLTVLDPEWPTVLNEFLTHPSELDE
jgi:hypothetical protein